MTILERIQQEVNSLPPDKQNEVLDFVAFLRQQVSPKRQTRKTSLRSHAAFGLWRGRNIDALAYEQNLRAEWDTPV